jgi:hypothetical protein
MRIKDVKEGMELAHKDRLADWCTATRVRVLECPVEGEVVRYSEIGWPRPRKTKARGARVLPVDSDGGDGTGEAFFTECRYLVHDWATELKQQEYRRQHDARKQEARRVADQASDRLERAVERAMLGKVYGCRSTVNGTVMLTLTKNEANHLAEILERAEAE